MEKQISVAHSPDADDVFMYYSLAFGWINHPSFRFCNYALDIETLNQKALNSEFDISAISFGLYPKISQEYSLLRTGVSFGEGYGPKLIKKKKTILKKNFKVALSGENTTNALLFKIAYPDSRIYYKNFLEIEQAVLEGEVDAGVLIHESILEFDSSLVVEREIWEIWKEYIKEDLPLPLGGMAIRRSIPLNNAILLEQLLTKGVEVAHKNPSLLKKMLYERNLLRVEQNQLNTYLSLYANAHSITLDSSQIKALDKLFELGFTHKFYPQRILTKDYLLPIEYQELRNS
ncbi:succinate--CoA ligase [Helicobacter monodelphidis]|uniref:menaquinone biosynthesis family protein n=1 Tax=Helicobacter sp. 15-1451 TaxID=2004995 RepID=UPI000DCF6206|nr:MqnA/MqnD/SBP family protein [Helicobacter sp. 15-1451]RAX59248.1 succinate--CoA ligase [Helicobacter sp. 15-1451]